ncbi:hypothetical protein [Aestuariibaculum marinum]|uniref:Uncharacterized protein n=1 Tax=Aestuariibaculum marinum TaxID=2683592 RepID=A0A8J6Q1U7_9FLAO|nr:hypothetical protein [Aestuariibaculum marinum]MBD0823023.1 hypothetical protein [Aestuariibaculum marinum]
MENPSKNINPNIFNIPKMTIPEPDWEALHNNLSDVNLEDVFDQLKEQNKQLRENNDKLVTTLTEQHSENRKLSSSNSRLTWLTILITVFLGVPNLISMFSENYNQKMFFEQKEQNRLLKEHTDKLNSMLYRSISLQEKLLNQKTIDGQNESDN